MRKKEIRPDQRRSVGIFKILRAVAIGVGLYALLNFSPLLILKLQGVDLNRSQAVVEENEPVYHDKSGKRINKPEYDLMAGYDAAKKNGIVAHADCKATYQHFMKTGCERYVTEQKNIPDHVKQGNWGSGKTTAECRTEVDAYWRAVTQDEREKGGDHAANVWTQDEWMPELQECRNYDNVRISKVVYEPTNRLDALLKKLEQGGAATQEDREIVRHDMQQVSTFPDNPHKNVYFEKTDHFFQLADGLVKPHVEPPLKLSCEEFQTKIDELRSAEKHDVVAQALLKQGDNISNGAQWDALNKSRIDRLWPWKRYIDGAKTADCNISATTQ